jgi:3-mercaptopropionate dioxygenase
MDGGMYRAIPLERFLCNVRELSATFRDDDVALCAAIGRALSDLLPVRGWLPPDARRSAADGYQRHLLYEDPSGLFSVGSYVWRGGQFTPIHDHRCWGVVAVLEGSLENQEFDVMPLGMMMTSRQRIEPGDVVWMSPKVRDIHRMGNPGQAEIAISIHVYGARLTEVCRTRYAEGPGRLSDPIMPPSATWADASTPGSSTGR